MIAYTTLLLVLTAPTQLSLDSRATQTIAYGVTHKLHHVDGTTHQVTGAAVLSPDGTVRAAVKALITSFDSGNGNRDEHMQETVDAIHFPDVRVKAVMSGVVIPKTFPANLDGQAQVEVTLHGVAQKVTLPVKLTFKDATHLHVTGEFTVSWDGFQIHRPALLFVPIDDKGEVKFDLTWSVQGS